MPTKKRDAFEWGQVLIPWMIMAGGLVWNFAYLIPESEARMVKTMKEDHEKLDGKHVHRTEFKLLHDDIQAIKRYLMGSRGDK
jgi:lipopolysaccharide export LptBFGC system permease protein LptF